MTNRIESNRIEPDVVLIFSECVFQESAIVMLYVLIIILHGTGKQ